MRDASSLASWIVAVAAVSVYTFIAHAAEARIPAKPNLRYGARFSSSVRGWSASLGFFLLGNFVAACAVYQVRGHLLDWKLEPLLYLWPIVLIELLMLVVISVMLSLPTALIPSRVRIPWLGVGIVLMVLGMAHGARSPVEPP
jgi:hypothetical protein